jgi:hypothetical protein
MSITDIVNNIDQRLGELETELAHLNRARAALVGRTSPAAEAKPARARRQPPKPAYEVVPVGKLIALLSGTPGMRTRELSQASNGDPGQVLALLKEQEDAGEVRRTGTRAATRWHVVTDEDRIAARAAELQAGSRQARARRN